MKEFVESFFRTYGAEVEACNGEIVVQLRDELRDLFEQDALRLVFDARDVDEDSELVTHGGYILSAIHSFLQDKGVKVIGRLPDRHPFDRDEMKPSLIVQGGRITDFRAKKDRTADCVFYFKVTFLSDEKSEKLYAVGTDRHGALFDAEEYYTDDVILKDIVPLAQKGSIDLTRKDIEKLFRDCLKSASERARSEAAELQREVLQRLHRSVTRIKGYYTAQIQELHRNQSGYEDRRLAIEREQQHKLSEEISNHRIRIVLKLINLHIVERTETLVTLTVQPAHGDPVEHVVQFDHFTGLLDYGTCPSCRMAMDTLVLTEAGEIACPKCTTTCHACGRISRDLHRVAVCQICERPTCDRCAHACTQCGKRICADHAHACAIGHEISCDECNTQCEECGKPLCKEHVFVCAASGASVCFEHRVICTKCRRVYSSRTVARLKKSERICTGCGTSLPAMEPAP